MAQYILRNLECKIAVMSSGEDINSDAASENPWDSLELVINTDQISKEGRRVSVDFTLDQLKSFIKALDLDDLEVEKIDFHLQMVSKNRFSLKGVMRFKVEQKCIVSLEPVTSEFSEKIEARFWPEEAVSRYLANLPEIEEDPFEDEPEIIENDQINLGKFIYETLATLIDPYPRKDEAEFDWKDSSDQETSDDLLQDKPFAALKILKNNGSENG